MSALLGHACAFAREADAAVNYRVIAVAADVGAAVISDPAGNAKRYTEGDWLPGKAWRIQRVSARALYLRSAQRLGGSPVEWRLAEGDAFDPVSLDLSIRQSAEPVYRAAPLSPQRDGKPGKKH